jgi:orotate phosphoribosyltransferase-like protein
LLCHNGYWVFQRRWSVAVEPDRKKPPLRIGLGSISRRQASRIAKLVTERMSDLVLKARRGTIDVKAGSKASGSKQPVAASMQHDLRTHQRRDHHQPELQ